MPATSVGSAPFTAQTALPGPKNPASSPSASDASTPGVAAPVTTGAPAHRTQRAPSFIGHSRRNPERVEGGCGSAANRARRAGRRPPPD